MKVAVVIPAYNEEDRLGTVLQAVKSATLLDDIVVVNDGSSDGTYAVATSTQGVRVVDLKENLGKGGAMWAGANNTDADVILFLDADLIGLKGDQIDELVRPLKDGETDMSVGVFKAGRTVTDMAQKLVPYISGQRALYRERFLEIPGLSDVRSGVEAAITKYYYGKNLRVTLVVLEGVTHAMKEEKMGVVKGFLARMKMYRDIFRILVDGHAYKKLTGSRRIKAKSNAP